MTLIEKVKAADSIEFMCDSYVYVGYDDIERKHQFKLKGEYSWEGLTVSQLERAYKSGSLKLYKMVEL